MFPALFKMSIKTPMVSLSVMYTEDEPHSEIFMFYFWLRELPAFSAGVIYSSSLRLVTVPTMVFPVD